MNSAYLIVLNNKEGINSDVRSVILNLLVNSKGFN